MELKSTAILAVEGELGGQVLTHEELKTRFGAEQMQKVLSGAGIRNRRIAPEGVCGSDMAYNAALRLMQQNNIDPQSIDLLIFCTQSPDHWMPTTACIMHERLGLKKQCAAFDINLGCSQYIYGLSVAHSMLMSGCASRALVLTGDTMSRTVHPRDRSVVPLMGDGGSATLIGVVDAGEGFLGFELGTDGSGHQYLTIPAGGARMPISEKTRVEEQDAEGNVRTLENLHMNGAAIFHFAISVVPPTIKSILQKLSLSFEDIDVFLFHQANKFMLDYLVKKLKIPAEKTHFYIEDVGNTSGSTIPILLADAIQQDKIKAGNTVLAIGFGVGLSWAATVMRWPKKNPLFPSA
jgi:3-oxoacyl-[acyl-carrier-protein] synthase III